MSRYDYFSAEDRTHYNTEELYNDDYLLLRPLKPKNFIPPTFITYNITEINQNIEADEQKLVSLIEGLIPDKLSSMKVEITNYVLNHMQDTLEDSVRDAIQTLGAISDEELDTIVNNEGGNNE